MTRRSCVLLAQGAAVVAVLAQVAVGPARADDLRDALVNAYKSNPTLEAARANQRAVDDGVPIARSAGLPSLNGTNSYTEFVKTSANSFTAPARAFDAQANLSVPLYSGGAVRNSLQAAQTRVNAGKDDLRSTESSVFTQTVAAYLDVIANEAVVGLSRKNVDVLTVNYKATSDQFEIGNLTRTDVAQSNSRLALARGSLRGAEANLVSAREKYIQIVGKAPIDLAAPPPLPLLPAGPDEAVAIALQNNPDLLAAQLRSKAAGYDVKVAGAGRLPKVSAVGGVDYTNYIGTLGGGSTAFGKFAQKQTTAQVGLRASIPIFQGGLPAAQQRQAQARESQVLEQEIGVERQVIAGVRSAYSSWRSATDVIATYQTAVDAAALSLEGVRAERTVGNRTVLDILNAEQELLNAQVQLVTARRNAYVAGFNLISAIGRAEARDLGLDAPGVLGGQLYDPDVNYRRVRNTIWDWARDPEPVAQATRTVDTPAQDAKIRAITGP